MRQAPGIYMISVVAETLEMHPQTLRKYERAGFIAPLRVGALRTYSDEDIARLRLIKHFVEDMGLNLAGVELALTLASKLLGVRRELSSQKSPAAAVVASIQQIDAMLEDLGIRVVRQRDADKAQSPPPEGRDWFQVNPGETVEFHPAAPDSGRQQPK